MTDDERNLLAAIDSLTRKIQGRPPGFPHVSAIGAAVVWLQELQEHGLAIIHDGYVALTGAGEAVLYSMRPILRPGAVERTLRGGR